MGEGSTGSRETPNDGAEKKLIIDHLLLRLLGCDDYNFRFYLRECLCRLPVGDLRTIVYERDVHVLVTRGNTVIDPDPILFDRGRGDRVLVVFVTNFSRSTPSEMLYTIAHEFAHVFLRHYDRANWRGYESELEADRQVVAWGFERELREAGFSYLSAPG